MAPLASWNHNQTSQEQCLIGKSDNPENSGPSNGKDVKTALYARKGQNQGQTQQPPEVERQNSEQGKPNDQERPNDQKYSAGTPFVEKHLVESLDVESADPAKSVLFYNMLNQGLKRGK